MRRILVFFGRYLLAPLVVANATRSQGEQMPISVHLLLSSKTWEMGLMAVLSLEYFSGKRWHIFIHEDGSLDESSQRSILAKLPGAVLVTRQEAEVAFSSRFGRYPACARNRSNHNFFLKLFDPWLHAPHEKYILLDADVIFYRPPVRLWSGQSGMMEIAFT